MCTHAGDVYIVVPECALSTGSLVTPVVCRMSRANYTMAVFKNEQLAVFKEQFDRFDTNGDGKIHGIELGPLMVSLGLETSAREVKAFLTSVDTDRNGSIDFEEFTAMMVKKVKQRPLKVAFSVMDRNGDGYVTKDEFRQAVEATGMAISEFELECVMARTDADGDGKISYEDFVAMMET